MFSSKIAGDKQNVVHPSNFYMEARHSMFLAITLAGVATPLTSYCIIGADFALNIYHGWKIVTASKNTGKSKDEGKNTLRYLIVILCKYPLSCIPQFEFPACLVWRLRSNSDVTDGHY